VKNIRRYAELDLTVNISEIDVRISKLPANVDKEAAQCDIYGDLTRAVYREKNFSGLTFWGFTDKVSGRFCASFE
jgi:endo-1,4-beta-xylanase